jgi:hypothetical protein
MKLTNQQLDVLANSIHNKVKIKQEAFRLTPEFTALSVAVRDRYASLLEDIRAYQTANETINELNRRKVELTTSIREKSGLAYSSSIPYSEDKFDVFINNKVAKELDNTMPSLETIKSDIILMTIENQSDIVTAINTKYNLE